MHKDLAAKHGWKVGDKVKLDSNVYDADNEKGAKETVEVTIKGLFDGHNKSAVQTFTLLQNFMDTQKTQPFMGTQPSL